MTLWQRVVEANRPGPPEHSIPFRVASVACVVTALAACLVEGELSAPVAGIAAVATVAGNLYSYRRREAPWFGIKPILAVCVIGGFTWFIVTAGHAATPGDIATVEAPLAVLFAWVLTTHAFDVPARKDVTYTVAGSAALMAVAAAQSVDLRLAGYVVIWAVASIAAMVAMWQSMSGTRGVPWRSLGMAGAVVVVVAVVFIAVVPPPHVSANLAFPSSAAGDSPVTSPNNLTDGSSGSLPAHAAPVTGPTRVGGYLGFARSLNTGIRGTLSNRVVLRVRADRPGYWVGQTYDTWNGQSWSQSVGPSVPRTRTLTGGSPFNVPTPPDQLAPLSADAQDIETFYLAESGPNLIFHSGVADRVYLPTSHLLLTGDGTIVSSVAMGKGTIYTVVASDTRATPAELRSAASPTASLPAGLPAIPLSADQQARFLQLPAVDPRVAALAHQLAASVGAGSDPGAHAYDVIQAIEGWIGAHTKYSTSIPPLAPGQDSVTQFLFGNRVGFCEQISTATVVMLRSLGIPAREATGYVPGNFNPITDLYDVYASDAHAWVQVWFPGYGWQNFDPTAHVPLANPTPGSVIAHDLSVTAHRVPWVPVGIVVLLGVVAIVWRRRRAARPATWGERIARDLGRAGDRAGLPRQPAETLVGYARRLAALDPGEEPATGGRIVAAAAMVEAAAYGGVEPAADQISEAVRYVAALRLPDGSGGRHTSGTAQAAGRASS